MVKVQLNLRVNHYLLELLEHFKEVKQVSKTALVETAIKEFCERNKDEIVSEDLKVYLDYIKIEQARNHTKLEMRKATFINNAARRLKRMITDGITEKSLIPLLKVWCLEAEANGIEKVLFLESMQKTLMNSVGDGINEI